MEFIAIITSIIFNLVRATAATKNKKFIIIAVPNRDVRGGEYGAAFGCGTSHREVIEKHLSFRKASEMEQEVQEIGDNLLITYYFKNKLGKFNQEEIEIFTRRGFILDIVM